MKKKTIAAGIVVTGLAVVCALPYVGTRLFASNVTAGTATDPLVSRSYVDTKMNQIVAMLNNSAGGSTSSDGFTKDEIVAEVMSQLEYYYAAKSGGAAQTFTPVLLRAGEIMVGGEGTEIIPRSGDSVAHSTVPDGISDVTDGTDLKNGKTLKINHLLIVPRSDGRGIRAVTEAWVLVKGGYTIK